VSSGRLQDVEVKVTNFQSEDKGLATIAGDVFDVPIRPDIVHRVVRWQLAKRRQVRETLIFLYHGLSLFYPVMLVCRSVVKFF
jgi:hypothetical protein